MQEGVEPLGTSKVSDDPSEVDFGEARRLGIIEVIHSVPNRLEDPASPTISVAFYAGKNSGRLTKRTG